MSKKVCLILSDDLDPHVLAVLSHFKQHDDWIPWVLDTSDALRNLRIDMCLDDSKQIEWSGSLNGHNISSVRSIWYRRPGRPKSTDGRMKGPLARLAEEEMRSLLQNIYRIVDCPILPRPSADREADYKLLQLKVAASIGFKVPRTYISNNESSLLSIPADMGFFCIKALSAFHWYGDSTAEYALRSARVSRADLLDASASMTLCPTVIQEYVEKRYEWRITVVGRKVFACRIDSQSVAGAREDWRIVDANSVPHEMLRVEPALESLLFSYLDLFQLSYGAFDFIEQVNGEFVFLECNPNGQWLWIENLTGAPISKAIAEYLLR
ncbi:MAG: hypothetical protein KA765_07695 [Thermoflexales bacterium]|nr:hypothetical protein [Thermoflexales bacterium]